MRSVLVRSLRSVREKLLSEAQTQDEEQEEDRAALLDHLPVDLQVVILSYLAPADLCRLGGCSRFWRAMVQEPLLWRYFFLRDVSLWSSVDHLSLPRGEFLSATPAEPHGLDFMAEYIRCSPASRTVFQLSRPALDSVAYFLQNLVSWSEPRFSMFGPGLEQLDVSLMTTMMHSPHTLPIAGIPHRHIGGIGSGISFLFNGQHKFNIITLYSTNSTERERARVDQQSVRSKLFVLQEAPGDRVLYSVAPQVQPVCREVDGFIFVSNAETDRDRVEECSQLRAVLDPVWGPSTRPLLVLACVSRTGVKRIPCVTVAHQLQLPLLDHPWRVQDTVCEGLSGLLDGLGWLLKMCGQRI